MKAYNRRKILFLLSLGLCVAIVLIVSVTSVVLKLAGKNALNHFAEDYEIIADAAAFSLEELLSLRLQLVADIAAGLDLSRPADCADAIERLYDTGNGLFTGTGLFRAGGDVEFVHPPDAAKGLDGVRPPPSLSASAGEFGIDEAGRLIAWARVGGAAGEDAVFALISGEYIGELFTRKLGRLPHSAFLLNKDGFPLSEQVGNNPSSAAGKSIISQKISETGGFTPYSSSKGEASGKKPEMYLAYAPVRLPGAQLYLGIGVPRAAVSGFLVRNPLVIIGFASTRIAALLICAILFYFFDRRRLKSDQEAKQLREEQKLLARLEESEERYRTLVDNLLSSVVIFQDRQIKFANPMFYSLTQYTPEEVAHKQFDLYSIIYEEDRSTALENTARLLDGEEIETPREIRYVRKNGEIIIGLAFSSLIHFEGKRAIETVVVDITDIKKMEQELGETRKRLQYLLDNAPIMIFSLDQTGNFSYVNNETLRVTGYRHDDWIGKPFAPIVHPDDLALAVSKFEEGRRGIPRRDYKLRIRNAAGKLRVLHIMSDNILENEQYKGSLIIASDITDQQKLQQTIKETRDHLANIIENAGDAIITLDTEGNIVSWNKSAEAMFRFTSPESFHKPLQGLLNVKELPLEQFIGRVTRGETIRDVELECTREGVRLSALFTFSPIRDASGKIIGISCFAKDITERRNLEMQLERDKHFIDQLIENANALIAAGNERGKLVIFNRRFEEISGYTKEEALGQAPLELLVPQEYRATAAERLRSIRSNGPIVALEVPIVSREGKYSTVTWNAAAVDLPSGHAAIVVVGQDVTDQKRMQEELMQSKKLASIGELVSGVAHELNNPLTVIMGYSQLLISEKALQQKHRDMAQKVVDAAGRSKRIVENLLAFARKKQLQKQEISLNEILENTLMLREHNLAVNNVSIIREYDERLPLMYADGHQLQQVFLNLINNAFDSMFEANRGGTLLVKTCRQENMILVEVIDDGPGVPEAIQDKIFDPFFTTKEVGRGTGLGMSLSYGIVKEHGGRIYLDRTYRSGAKFITEFPLNQDTPADAPSSHM